MRANRMPKNKGQQPTLKQHVSGGRYMELAIKRSGVLIRRQSEARQSKALTECRKNALAVLSEATGFLYQVEREEEMDRKQGYYICCLVAFVHGVQWTQRLISDGQYIKAAGALKQDYELLTRMHEVDADCALEGRTPNVRHAPAGSQLYYGELNKITHPSNLDCMLTLLSARCSKYVSATPVFHRIIFAGFYRIHVWVCGEMARQAIMLLAKTLPEGDRRVSHWTGCFAHLCNRARAAPRIVAGGSHSGKWDVSEFSPILGLVYVRTADFQLRINTDIGQCL
jgi:hypothetical protein